MSLYKPASTMSSQEKIAALKHVQGSLLFSSLQAQWWITSVQSVHYKGHGGRKYDETTKDWTKEYTDQEKMDYALNIARTHMENVMKAMGNENELILSLSQKELSYVSVST